MAFRMVFGSRKLAFLMQLNLDGPMAAKKSRLTDAGKRLIHEFRNCVHQINMELDLAERGVEEKFEYANLISAVDSMNRSLEDLRVRLGRMEESRRGEKSIGDCADDCTGTRLKLCPRDACSRAPSRLPPERYGSCF
jgi:hypothetical protein